MRQAVRLARAGVTPALPVLRASSGRSAGGRPCRLQLRGGLTLVAPRGEPLTELLTETWLERRYVPAGLPPPGTVVDVGAHVGVFSLWAAVRLPQARIVAIEPASAVFRCLQANVEHNGLVNVETVQAAAGGQARRATLYQRGFAAANTLYPRDHYGSRFEPLEQVEVVPLGELFARLKIDRCDLLKLDCEGAEYELLLGAGEDVLQRIHGLAIEYHLGLADHGPAELEQLLAGLGFAVRTTPPQDVEAGGYLYAVR